MSVHEDQIREALKQVVDPELFVNVVDLGLVYVIDVQPPTEGSPQDEDRKSNVRIEMTMTSPACPAGPQLLAQTREVVSQIEGVGSVDVQLVMTPPWTPDRMTDEARDQLGIF